MSNEISCRMAGISLLVLSPQVLELSLDMYGCRVVQKAIEVTGSF